MQQSNSATQASFAFWAKWRGAPWKIMAQMGSQRDAEIAGTNRMNDTNRRDDPNPRTMILPIGEKPPEDPRPEPATEVRDVRSKACFAGETPRTPRG